MTRRSEPRPESHERRSFARPPLWLNLLLLAIAVGTFLYARHQHQMIEAKTVFLFQRNQNSPAELSRLRDQLSQMDLTEQQLAKELNARITLLDSMHGNQFYLAIDTTKKKLYFRFGDNVAREADIQVGPARTITADGKTWTFVPLKGSFQVTGKEEAMPWTVPEWVYAMNGQPVPSERPTIVGGLGRYVISLPNNYVIHSPPSPDSPLKGPKPGSIMVPEADLEAIWPRITTDTKVYIF